jgi:hypothetical protein
VATIPEPLLLLRLRADSCYQSAGSEAAKYGLFARYVASLRSRGDLRANDLPWVWGVLFPRYEIWFAQSGLRRGAEAAAQLRCAAIHARHRNYWSAFATVIRAAAIRPSCLVHYVKRRPSGWSDGLERQMNSISNGCQRT